ncbi:MAG: hypothetical protein ACLRQF_01075 [Thomasclavelia ramosa]
MMLQETIMITVFWDIWIKRYDDKDGYDAFNEHKEIITRILKYIIEDGRELN